MRSKWSLAACAAYLLLLDLSGPQPAVAAGAGPTGPVGAEIRRLLESGPLAIAGADILTPDSLFHAYGEVDFQPFWTDAGNIRELLELIAGASEHGLDPGDYSEPEIRRIVSAGGPQPESAAAIDILLTENLMRYAFHRRFGKIRANALDPNMNHRRETFNDQHSGTMLRQALKAPSLNGFIDSLAPTGPIYRALQAWLQRYREIETHGGWPPVPEGPALRRGDRDPRVLALRERLRVTGEWAAPAETDPESFDVALEAAVKVFQRRHALEADGIVGRNSLAALNVPVARRIDQLRLSLERLRWVNQEAAQTLVAVNIAGFRAFFFRAGSLVWETRAMVGRTYRQTPTFRGEMAYVEFNPTWTIPPVILKNDTLPAIRRDPGYLTAKNIRVFDSSGRQVDPSTVDWNRSSLPYTLRQDPGPDNSLGAVKFIFPNPYLVFLHDTPNRKLFERPERAFSSGCIRIEDPLTLAELVLDDPTRYPRSALEAIVASGRTERIRLDHKMPVLIVYLTASIDQDGGLLLYRDIYERDAKALEALNGPVIVDPPPQRESMVGG